MGTDWGMAGSVSDTWSPRRAGAGVTSGPEGAGPAASASSPSSGSACVDSLPSSSSASSMAWAVGKRSATFLAVARSMIGHSGDCFSAVG